MQEHYSYLTLISSCNGVAIVKNDAFFLLPQSSKGRGKLNAKSHSTSHQVQKYNLSCLSLVGYSLMSYAVKHHAIKGDMGLYTPVEPYEGAGSLGYVPLVGEWAMLSGAFPATKYGWNLIEASCDQDWFQ